MWRAWLVGIALLSGCGGVPAGRHVPRSSEGAVLRLAGAEIRIELAQGLAGDRAAIQAWVADGATAMGAYYGRLPVRQLTVQVNQADRAGVRGGRSFGYPHALIQMAVGTGTTTRQFQQDWMMTHELVHLTFPSMPDVHLWAHEGLATYVEPLARHQAGQLSAEKVWRDLIDGLPKGVAELARAGLDENGSWGATYWGGAYFWLLADLDIRQRTEQRKTLRDALLAILEAGGSSGVAWPVRDTLHRGDQAIGAPVLVALYDSLRRGPRPIDLDGLWRQLGVSLDSSGVRFDENAPLAALRRSIAG